jgi:Mlc titration factor MtfA (ptsG expression regulator)
MPNQVDALLKQLLSEKKYIPIQKAIIKKTPLIDYTLLLVLLIFLLGIEWFTRKYNGML